MKDQDKERTLVALFKQMAMLPREWAKIRSDDVETLRSLAGQDHEVFWILDRQKPSVEQCYDFDEERLGITKEGKIVVGFDSGCSCPSPWDDNYPECYDVMSLEEFIDSDKDFDGGVANREWWYEAYVNIAQVLLSKSANK